MRQAEYVRYSRQRPPLLGTGTLFGHTGAFYFKDTDGVISPDGKVIGVFTSDGGIPGFEDFHAKSRFFPVPNPSVNGNLSHTADYAI